MDKQHCRAKPYGFTLVEMSIVLVIIALLIGGLVGLRSYTRNSALNTMMNETKIYISAFNQFQNRYGSPPGDYSLANSAWSAADNGDGNGLVRATSTAGNGNRDELFYAFEHLALAGYIPGSYTGATTGGGGTYHARIGTNVPGSAIDKVAFLFDHPDYEDGTPDGFIVDATNSHPLFFEGLYPNVLRVAGLNDNDTDIPARGFMTPAEARQLDEKFDDSMPGLGLIVAPKSAGQPNCSYTPAPFTTDAPANSLYETSTYDKTCWILVKIQ